MPRSIARTRRPPSAATPSGAASSTTPAVHSRRRAPPGTVRRAGAPTRSRRSASDSPPPDGHDQPAEPDPGRQRVVVQPHHGRAVPLLTQHGVDVREARGVDRRLRRRHVLHREGAARRVHQQVRPALADHADVGHALAVVRALAVGQRVELPGQAGRLHRLARMHQHDALLRQRHAGDARDRHAHAGMGQRGAERRHRQTAQPRPAVAQRDAEQADALDDLGKGSERSSRPTRRTPGPAAPAARQRAQPDDDRDRRRPPQPQQGRAERRALPRQHGADRHGGEHRHGQRQHRRVEERRADAELGAAAAGR